MGARERFIESIEYLRKMGFFEEYCNLSSEEIFEKIRENSIALKYLGVKEVEERWMKESVYEVDSFIAIFDKRRVLGKDVEVVGPEKGLSTEIFKEIVRISRGVFQPTDIEEEWLGHNTRIHFTFRGKRHVIDFCFYTDLLQINPIMRRINSLIEDTGYQYYELLDGNQTFLPSCSQGRKPRNSSGKGDGRLVVNGGKVIIQAHARPPANSYLLPKHP